MSEHTLSISKPRHYAQALRLVDTKNMDHDQWLAVRQQGIGGSDAAAAVGLNPYHSPLELWLEKTGRVTPATEPEPDTDSPLYWGTVLEPIVAEQYARRKGYRVRRVNAVLQHPEHPWMLVNLDREIVGQQDVKLLQCKTAGLNGARLWRDGVPEYVIVQVMHELAVTGYQAADVAVLIAGQQLEIHRIERREDVIADLIAQERRFWQAVEDDVPPPPDGSASSQQALRRLYPQDKGTTLDFRDDPERSRTFTALLDVRQQLDELGREEAQLKQQLQSALGEASYATFANGSISWKRTKDGSRIDVQALEQAYPALCAHFRQTVAGSRRFVIRD